MTLTRFSHVKCSVSHMKEAVHEWAVFGCRLCLRSKLSREEHWCQGQLQIFAPSLCLNYTEACAGEGFRSQRPLRVPGNSLLPQSGVLSLSSRWLNKVVAERVWADCSTLPLVVLMLVLFKEAFVEQLRVARPSFILQAEEQVPEVDSGDALSHELSGAGSAWASGLGGPWP